MPALAVGQSSSCANPVLDLYTQVDGVLTNLYSLEFQVFDFTEDPAGEQVYPATLGDRATVAVGTDCPTGDRLSTGRYVARWTVPLDASVGSHTIRWFIKLTDSSAEQTYEEEFEVLPEVVGTGSLYDYVRVADMREEGVSLSSASNKLVAARIRLASRTIERVTGRRFYPYEATYTVDGKGSRALLLGEPIIGIESVAINDQPFQAAVFVIDPGAMRIYNRHLSQGMVQPDDRNNPKIELYHASESLLRHRPHSLVWPYFPRGQQNITVTGVFGYTDYDGPNTTGQTPDLIKQACKLLTLRELAKVGDTAARFEATERHRILSERTRDQSYTMEAQGRRAGALFTGDPAVDNILAAYLRPPMLGAA